MGENVARMEKMSNEFTKCKLENLKERNHLNDQGVDGRVIL
jgi:hypothetical protein